MSMKPRINVMTMAVDDLDKSLAFYRDGLGLPTKGIIGNEFKGSATEPAGAVAFFELQGGLMLALYPRSELIKDANVPNSPPSHVEFSLGYIAESRDAVDELLRKKSRRVRSTKFKFEFCRPDPLPTFDKDP